MAAEWTTGHLAESGNNVRSAAAAACRTEVIKTARAQEREYTRGIKDIKEGGGAERRRRREEEEEEEGMK